jgi:hypothetical protein
MRSGKLLLAAALALIWVGLASAQYGDISDLKLLKPEDKEHAKSVPPPKDAIILFDGKSLDDWTKTDGKTKPDWKLLEGGIMQVEGGDNIISKKMLEGNFKLHVEFRVPYLPKEKGQARGNSGVYVQGRYEVQVLDSYGLDSKDNDCGAIYGVAAPLKNACKAPTVWQTYDIEFYSPVCENGKKVEPPRVTVHHNGVLIHDNLKITKDNTTAGLGGDVCKPGPLMLQSHGAPVQFRNIWMVPVK